jgi:hypothetical protein
MTPCEAMSPDGALGGTEPLTHLAGPHALRDFGAMLVRRELGGASFPTRICSGVGTEIVAVVLAIAP